MSNVSANPETRERSSEPGGERTVTVGDGRALCYAEYGAAAGRPVVFLHGTPGSRVLGSVLDGPARDRGVRVLAPDRPGFGRSPPRPGQSPGGTAEDLATLVDHAGVDEVRVVGFSGGALSALALAASAPDRVRRVDLISGAAPPSLLSSTPTVQRLLDALARRAPRLLQGLVRGQRWAAGRLPPGFVLSQYTTTDAAPIPDDVAAVVRDDFVEALAVSRRGLVDETRRLHEEWSVPFDEVGQPVRLWHGALDENAPVEGARRFCDRLPDARLAVFDDADHLGALVRSRERLFEDD
jgi:pimeloyl-ACP methyl ester carboxylesterase